MVLNEKKEKEEKNRNYSFLLPLVAFLMILSALFGLVASFMSMSSERKYKQINDYVDSRVVFTVIGTGVCKDSADKKEGDRMDAFASAYDDAYNICLEKAGLIAANTGKSWRITNVEEVSSNYDYEESSTISVVKLSFAVNNE